MKNQITLNGRTYDIAYVDTGYIIDNFGDNPWWNLWAVTIHTRTGEEFYGSMQGDDRADSWAYDSFELDPD